MALVSGEIKSCEFRVSPFPDEFGKVFGFRYRNNTKLSFLGYYNIRAFFAFFHMVWLCINYCIFKTFEGA